jgi:hypothetical protein
MPIPKAPPNASAVGPHFDDAALEHWDGAPARSTSLFLPRQFSSFVAAFDVFVLQQSPVRPSTFKVQH